MKDIVTYPSPTEMRFSRLIAAPLASVWRAHTEQGHLQRWWGPEAYTITTHEMDVRPGGRWKFIMHGPGVSADPNSPFAGPPTDFPNLIQYEEVVPEQKLVWSHGNFEEVLFHVTATFKAEGDGTRLESTMRLRSQAERDAQATYAVPGHESTMNKLEAYLQQNFKQSATLKRD